jgi:2-oxo-4-hydroxy-4-carboxy-5-ureidoimidazoline decarboxylase
MLNKPRAVDMDEFMEQAKHAWRACSKSDWLEAFSHHPRIGDLESLREKFASTATYAAGEQEGTRGASEQTLHDLAEGNTRYEEKFGFIFIVCATGKSAQEMLDNLNMRMKNTTELEFQIAGQEQFKITKLRIEKLFAS